MYCNSTLMGSGPYAIILVLFFLYRWFAFKMQATRLHYAFISSVKGVPSPPAAFLVSGGLPSNTGTETAATRASEQAAGSLSYPLQIMGPDPLNIK